MKKTAKRPLTDEEIMAYDNVPIDVAARYIGWSSPTIYRALREERAPFGFAVCSGESLRYPSLLLHSSSLWFRYVETFCK